MRQNRFNLRAPFQHPDPKLGRLLLLSLTLHIVLVLSFTLDIWPRSAPPKKTTYYVDLVNMPVKSPQAGRPDARPKAKPVKRQAQAARPQAPPAAKAKAPVVKRSTPAKTVKTPAKAKAEPAPKVSTPDRYQGTLSAIDRIRQRQEREALKQQAAALAAAAAAPTAAPTRARLGMADGTGTEAGPSEEEYLKEHLTTAWSLSEYQVGSLDPEAKVLIIYDAAGNLLDYRFLEKSGEPRFDDSLKRAILKGNPLPFQPGSRWEVPVTFNLKDMERRGH